MTTSPTDIPSKLKPLAEELLDNDYARENLQEGVEKLREGTAALASGRKKPKRTGSKVAFALIGVAATAAAVVLATNEGLRNQVLGSAKALGDEIIGGDEAPKPE
jgi:X-X-X-Leu-X-X-Gly heptad repeat protein